MNLFAQIRKVDEAKRLVFGRIAEEAVDKSDEIMDYASSKPHFIKWSEDIAKDTDGKSLGNVRAMHGKVAAGKLTQIDFNDTEKAVDVCAKVVDDGEWKKVMEGVYSGFSIGGAYVGDKKVEKADGRDVTRYTARPSEVSLVDRPCMPGARFFEVQKADGELQKVDFQAQPAADPPADEAPDAIVEGTAEQVDELCRVMKANGLTLSDVLEKALPAFIADKKKGAKTSTDPDGDGDAAVDTDKDGDGGKPAAKMDDDAEKAETEADLVKIEATLTDALAKIGARNSRPDAARIKTIHDMTVELGALCGPAEKAAPAGELAKVEDSAAMQKLLDDAIAPLQKALADVTDLAKAQAEKITKLEAQPAPARVSLRAVSKGEDIGAPELKKADEPAPIKDDMGDVHEAAGLIKSLHSGGGRPLAMPL